MIKNRELCATKLEELRRDKFLSVKDFAEEIGISGPTYIRFVDPYAPPLSYSTMRAIRDYMFKLEQQEE